MKLKFDRECDYVTERLNYLRQWQTVYKYVAETSKLKALVKDLDHLRERIVGIIKENS